MTLLLDSLRDMTRDAHEALHVHPALKDLTTPDVTPGYYRHALSRFYGFYQIMEQAFENGARAGLEEFDPLMARRNLRCDLETQGIDPAGLPCLDGRNGFSLEEGIGFLYLREGSTLGGQQISKALQKNLNLEPGVDNRFFYGYGTETGPRWKLFQKKLLDMADRVDHHAVAGAARHLFHQLGHWLHV